MSKLHLSHSTRLLWSIVVLLGFVTISWRTLISSFAGNVGLLFLARAMSSSDRPRLESESSAMLEQEQARRWLHIATQINAANTSAWRGQGLDLAAQGQEQEALAAWRAARTTGQEFIQRGEAARLAGNYLEALAWYERAEKVDPSLPSSVLYFQFLTQQALGSADLAFNKLGQAVMMDHGWVNPEIRFRAWQAWGVWFVEQQRYPEAESVLKIATAMFPDDPLLNPLLSETYRFLGLSQWSQNSLDQAVQNLGIAVQVDRQNIWAHIHYGKVLYLHDPNRVAETEDEFTTALQLAPNNVAIWKNLVEFWRWVNEGKKAELLCSEARTHGMIEVCLP